MNIDKLFDIYEEFLRQTRMNVHIETARCDDNGNERLVLKFDCGFTVEITKKKNVENSGAMRCWWKDKDPVEVESLEQLFKEFANSN